MGSNIIKPLGIGPYCFRVQGSIHHFLSPLHPNRNDTRKFSQLYILDPGKLKIGIIFNK